MDRSGEVWIALVDPHERRMVEGAWSLAVLELGAAGSVAGPSCILADARIRCCIQGLMPDERIVTPAEGRLPRRSPLFTADVYDGVESLMILAAAMEKTQPSAVRTFGLRAGVLGRILAESRRIPLTAVLVCPSQARIAAEGEMRLRTRRSLENWVTAGAAGITTLTAEQAESIRRRTLPDGVEIRAFGGWPQGNGAGCSAEGSVAVLASADDAEANEFVLRSLAALPESARGLRIHWLARRGSVTAMRAAQDFRRFGLAPALRWEDEPWMHPPWRNRTWWDLLLVVREGGPPGPAATVVEAGGLAIRNGGRADPEASASAHGPLAEAARAAGVPVLVVSRDDSCETVAAGIRALTRPDQGSTDPRRPETLQPERR